MAFTAKVVRILIASPSDTHQLRLVARQATEDWNSFNAASLGIVFLPLLWERDTIPEVSDRPQGAVNRQLVEKADATIAIFWSRLGSPTGEAESGTVEEVESGISDGRPVLIYFCEQPFPQEIVTPSELERLAQWRTAIQGKALIHTFVSEEELAQKLFVALTKLAREHFGRPEGGAGVQGPPDRGPTAPMGEGRADPLARVDSERELRGFSKSGSPRYTTRHRMFIENRGTAAAEDFSFHFEASSDDDDPNSLPTVLEPQPVARFAPGAVLEYPMLIHMGTARQAELVMEWREGDKNYRIVQTVTV